MRYEIVDHTADVGIRAFGKDLRELFSTAAYGMFHILADLGKVREAERTRVEARGEDLEELLHEWLSELLYIYEVRELLFRRFDIEAIDQGRVSAICWGESRDLKRHRISREIKSVTYHELKVEKTAEGWVAEVIFDI